MRYYLVAGEASGYLHGANLMKVLKALDADPEAFCFLLPSVKFSALSERLLQPSAETHSS